jgi:hypothetical protein
MSTTQQTGSQEIARAAAITRLASRWSDLAALLAEVDAHAEEAKSDPLLLADPLISAEQRWRIVFADELKDVQTVYESASGGRRVKVDAMSAAADAAEKLIDILTRAREKIAARDPADAAQSTTAEGPLPLQEGAGVPPEIAATVVQQHIGRLITEPDRDWVQIKSLAVEIAAIADDELAKSADDPTQPEPPTVAGT